MAEWPYNTAAWKRLRKAHLSAFPWCEGCKAMGKPHVLANTVDHRHAIKDGGNPFPGHDGLASYCPGCHSAKTARGTEAGAVRSSKPRRGCDAEGNPLDARHPWAIKSDLLTNEKKVKLGVHEDKKSLRAEPKRTPPYTKIELVNLTGKKAERHGR